MTFLSPFWLLLAVPALVALWLRPLPGRLLMVLRVSVVVLLLLALAGLSVKLPSRDGCVVVVADRSLSMPEGSAAQQLEAIELLHHSMSGGDELGVVAFGQQVTVEQAPQGARFAGFAAEVGREASNLADAVDRAVSLIPRERPGRVLILSDGCATGRDVAAAAARAASLGVALDYRAMQRSTAGDLAVERIDAPSSVAEAEAFMISAWVTSPQAQEIDYELLCEDKVLATGRQAVPAGRSRLVFRDIAGVAGSRPYVLRVTAVGAAQNDPTVENNRARFLVGVRGTKRLLCVGPAASALPRLLEAGGLRVERRTPEQCDWSLAGLAGYSAVLIENTSAEQVGTAGMENVAAWVTEGGGGLLTTGGRGSYGSGGYFKSPLEPVLPVSMELRREHRKLSLAIVVALDRSGSMAMAVPGGRRKIDLANLATAEVLNQLSGTDQFGCLAVDSIAHQIVPLSDLTNKAQMERKVLSIDSMGGGIFIYEALEKAAAMIAGATAGTRHIILFADAADSEEPGNYRDLLAKLHKAGVTVSVIGLGTARDVDAGLLKDIARLGGGQCMFTTDAQELPRLFAQDTFLVSRSTFVEEPTVVRTTAGLSTLTSQAFSDLPRVGGYNLCYLRTGANLAIVTEDEYHAPLVAAWQAGLGRVLCYTGEADGKFTGAVAGWPQVGEFYASLARWVSAQDQGLGNDMLLTQELRDGVCRIKLHLDSERTHTPFNTLPQLTLLRGREGNKPTAERLPLNWQSADALEAEVPLVGDQTLLASLDLPGIGRATLPPTCLPYSAEFAPRQANDGSQKLASMARISGGVERVDLASIWRDLPRLPRYVPLAPWLLLAATVLLLVEVLQRRTGVLSLATRWRAPAQSSETSAAAVTRPRARQKVKGQPVAPSIAATSASAPPAADQPSATGEPTPAPASEPARETVADALSQARQRAARRTQR